MNYCHPLASCEPVGNTITCICPNGMTGNGIGVNGCVSVSVDACSSQPCLVYGYNLNFFFFHFTNFNIIFITFRMAGNVPLLTVLHTYAHVKMHIMVAIVKNLQIMFVFQILVKIMEFVYQLEIQDTNAVVSKVLVEQIVI